MHTYQLQQGGGDQHGTGSGSVTKKMIRERAVEIARSDGRQPYEATKADWDQAKREFNSETKAAATASISESIPETERWPALPYTQSGQSAAACI